MSIEEANKIRKARPKTGTCWSCREITMVECPELGAGWYKCSKCGATWIKLPKVVQPALKAEAYATVTGRHFSPRVAAKKEKAKK